GRRPVPHHDAVVLPGTQPTGGIVVPARSESGVAWKDETHHVMQIRLVQPPDQLRLQHVVRRRGHRAQRTDLARDEAPRLERLQAQDRRTGRRHERHRTGRPVTGAPRPLSGSSRPLTEVYDVALLDLDGVVYVGPDAVPGAPEQLRKAAEAGLRIGYITNNASRTPEAVAEHLRTFGLPARTEG